VLGLGLFAYRPLILSALPQSQALGNWFFLPDTFAPQPILGVAAWLLWRRRARLLSLPCRSANWSGTTLVATGVGLFVWAHLTRAAELLLPSLAANLLGFAAATRGHAGCRAVLLPAFVLLLGFRIPAPFGDELVWRLQLWTASGAAWVMNSLGQEVFQGGVHLESGERTFLVIESCSGLRGIQVLTLAALIVRELFADSGPRQWLLILVALWLGHALNVIRVVVVILLSTNPQLVAEHTPQGLGVIAVGSAILYVLGWAMARNGPHREPEPSPTPHSGAPLPGWVPAAACLAVIGVVSVAVRPFAQAQTDMTIASRLEFPMERSGWHGERVVPDLLFNGSLPPGQALYRRYQRKTPIRERPDPYRPMQVVELFVGLEVPRNRNASRLFSSRLLIPGRDWTLEQRRRVREWTLRLDAELAVVSRDSGSERALVYTWRVRHESLWREAWRSLLALESSPFQREPRRAVVRLLTPLYYDGPVARDRAQNVLERFVNGFRVDLANL
jgi:exosortase